MSTHVSWETLNDYADGRLSSSDGDAVAGHLDACDECRHTLERLRRVLTSARASATSVEPPAEAWRAIRAEIDTGKIVPLPSPARAVRQGSWMRIAAVVAIIAASSATTVAIMNSKKPPVVATIPQPDSSTPVVPASVREIDQDYADTVRTLAAMLEATRSKLAPETVEAVERNLKIIDTAIREAREALLRDPASAMLRGMLSKNYQQKVDLLKRAAQATTT